MSRLSDREKVSKELQRMIFQIFSDIYSLFHYTMVILTLHTDYDIQYYTKIIRFYIKISHLCYNRCMSLLCLKL